MKKNTVKALLALLIFAALTAVAIVIGLKAGYYAPAAPEEGEPLSAANWLPAVWWFVTGVLAALAVISLARLPLRRPGLPAWLKLLIYGIAVAAFVVGLVMAASDLGVDINAIVIGLGVVGTCVAIGCEPLMYDLVGGLGFISGRDFEVGDIITIDGFRGTVTDITLRCVKLRDAGGNINMVRNSEIASVVNLSRNPSTAVVRIPYDPESGDLVAFETRLKAGFDKLAAENPDVFPSAPVYQGVDSYDADGAVLLVTAEVPEDRLYAARRLMNRTVILLGEEEEEEEEEEAAPEETL